MIEAGVSDDSIEPGEEWEICIESGHGPVGLYEGILGDFECVFAVVDEAIGDCVCPFLVKLYELSECGTVALLGLGHEVHFVWCRDSHHL